MKSDAKRVIIRGAGFITPIGVTAAERRAAYSDGRTRIRPAEIEGQEAAAAPLPESGEEALKSLIAGNSRYKSLDRSVMMAIIAARAAVEAAGWGDDRPVAVNLASSRGATALFEKYHRAFLENERGRAAVLTSPTTTLGNISSWVLQDLKLKGIEFSHSITCSSAIQAIANAFAWLKSGLAERVLAGASEAPLTAFTIAQMQALKVYASKDGPFPCRPFAAERLSGDGMVLGEGAGVHALELGVPRAGDLVIEGFGLGNEPIDSPTSISDDGEALRASMRMALDMSGNPQVDAVIMHAPGTAGGDGAELSAVSAIFGDALPLILSNKWILGHTFGAAGTLNLEYAALLLDGMMPAAYPYPVSFELREREINRVMVNATGFGGNAGSVIIARVRV